MAGVPNILILALLLLITLINVQCDTGTSTSQQVEDCKNVCRKNFQDRVGSRYAIMTLFHELRVKLISVDFLIALRILVNRLASFSSN